MRPSRGFCLLAGVLAAALAATFPPHADAVAPQKPPRRIVAIGDVHGALEQFAAILKRAGLIDAQQRWSGGNTILVQTGDVTDRGTGMRAALDLLMSLEKQAADAGGRIHALLGNHEVMNAVGEMRDASPEIFATFGGDAKMREAFGPQGRYGRWLRSHQAIAEIDGSIFMHAGIDPAFAKPSIDELNRRVRREIGEWDRGVKWLVERRLVAEAPRFLDAVEAARHELDRLMAAANRDKPESREAAALLLPVVNIGTSALFSPNGPLWFRGFSTWSDVDGTTQIAALLQQLGAVRFVTGHTVQPGGRISDRFGGRLFLIDTGMLDGRFFPGGRPSALEIVGTTVTPIYVE